MSSRDPFQPYPFCGSVNHDPKHPFQVLMSRIKVPPPSEKKEAFPQLWIWFNKIVLQRAEKASIESCLQPSFEDALSHLSIGMCLKHHFIYPPFPKFHSLCSQPLVQRRNNCSGCLQVRAIGTLVKQFLPWERLLTVSLKLVHSKPLSALRIRLNLPFLKGT